MFRTVKRIIDWCGEFKGRLYAGFVFSFFFTCFYSAADYGGGIYDRSADRIIRNRDSL